ncbi:hypothetical protein LZ30DRAFT_65432 [Colletotrichum cereale]|nr:hypothetical protein LZ30DRAFT_65432 [Colletotrichum cereale]
MFLLRRSVDAPWPAKQQGVWVQQVITRNAMFVQPPSVMRDVGEIRTLATRVYYRYTTHYPYEGTVHKVDSWPSYVSARRRRSDSRARPFVHLWLYGGGCYGSLHTHTHTHTHAHDLRLEEMEEVRLPGRREVRSLGISVTIAFSSDWQRPGWLFGMHYTPKDYVPVGLLGLGKVTPPPWYRIQGTVQFASEPPWN